MTAADRWAKALASWAIPEGILAQTDETPWALPPRAFAESARLALERPPTPTHSSALEVLPDGGTVLDVGAGAGAASLPLSVRADLIVAVDQSPAMLAEMTTLVKGRVRLKTVEGLWPEAAARVAVADVAVCANVAYNMSDLGPFVAALTDRARRRVVLELTARHPQYSLNWLWKHFWNLDRPETPIFEDAAQVIREELGVEIEVARWRRRAPLTSRLDPDNVSWVRRRLCLPPSRDRELAQLLVENGTDATAEMATIWWAGRAG